MEAQLGLASALGRQPEDLGVGTLKLGEHKPRSSDAATTIPAELQGEASGKRKEPTDHGSKQRSPHRGGDRRREVR
jgi:hypothetical protein